MRIMKWNLFMVLFVLQVLAKNEPTSDNIAIGLAGTCLTRQSNSPCLNGKGQAITNQPEGYPCPCLIGDEGGSSYPGNGQTEVTSDNVGSFNDEVLVSSSLPNFGTITGMSFTDNTQELFIVAKAGYVFRYDLNLQLMTQWLDISDDIHDAGDYGLLSIETHPDFANNQYVYLTYAVKSIYGPNSDMNAISYMKVIRVSDLSNNGDPSSIVTLIGTAKNDSNVLCSSTHMGGAIAFGNDGSLLVTMGEGGHFDTDVMDFGQSMPDRYPYDDQCLAQFGAVQAIGALRAQSLDSLGGKLIRIDPSTGEGICSGNWAVLNPYCNGDPKSTRSRIYAMGLRNPYSMNVKPLAAGEAVTGPGSIYIGDVGLGSYEEINVANAPGMNFGWPCWEGPQPMAGYRDSDLNDLTNTAIRRPKTDDGTPFSCPYVYENVATTHPAFYWSRYEDSMGQEWQGLYGEEYMMNAGFVGNCVGGVSFYTGSNYPEEFQNRAFILDYGALWIKTLQMNDDKYESIHAFKSGISTPVVDLEYNPSTGDICYLAILAAEVHCITYSTSTPPPSVIISANSTMGSPGMAVAFSVDGSFSRDNNKTEWIAWTFSDGTPIVVEPNPVHVFTKLGEYNVSVVVNAAGYNVTKSIVIKVNGQSYPQAIINSPQPTDGFYGYDAGGSIAFSGSAQGGSGGYTYYWDTYMVHSNHYHPESAQDYNATFSADANALGASSHVGLRINFLIFFIVTDSNGNQGTSYVRVRNGDWQTVYGNNNPVASFTVKGYQPYETGQFVRVDASATNDIDLDYLLYKWDFGDNTILDFDPKNSRVVTSHAYKNPGTYTIVLTVQDNWGGEDTVTSVVTIGTGFVQNPPQIDNLNVITGSSSVQSLTTSSSSPNNGSSTKEVADDNTSTSVSTIQSSSSMVKFSLFVVILSVSLVL